MRIKFVKATEDEKVAASKESGKFFQRVGAKVDAAVAATAPKVMNATHAVTNKTAAVATSLNDKVEAKQQ